MTTTTPTDVPAHQDPNPKRRGFSAGFITAVALLLVIGGAVAWSMGLLKPRPTIAIVTNNADPFWDPVIAGAQAAADEHHVKLKIIKGTGDAEAQSNAVRELLAGGIDGLAISPIDADGQATTLREVSLTMPLVTIDSDSPNSGRQWFVGTDNYGAGRVVGSYVRDAIPDGGEVLITVGSVTAENGKLRRQGVIDELLDRPYTMTPAIDPLDATLKAGKHTIVATLVDMHDKDRAVQMAIDAIRKYPNLKCIVALYSYSTPVALKALEQAGKLGQINIIGFDVLPETLAGVEAGHVFATMQQAQYDFGYDSVWILAATINGEKKAVSSVMPVRYLGVSAVTQQNVAKVRQELAQGRAVKSPAEAPATAQAQ